MASMPLMEPWQRNLQIATAGIIAAAVVDAATGAERSTWERLGRCLCAGGIAFAYAQMVPPSSWGPRSGAEFAQLPLVASLATQVADVRPLELACWGGLTGLLLRSFH